MTSIQFRREPQEIYRTKKEKFLSTLQSRREQEKLVNPLSAKSNYELAKGEGGIIGG